MDIRNWQNSAPSSICQCFCPELLQACPAKRCRSDGVVALLLGGREEFQRNWCSGGGIFTGATVCRVAAKLGHTVLTWRRVPTNNAGLGDSAKATEPLVEQCFLSKSSSPQTTSPDPEAQVHHMWLLPQHEAVLAGMAPSRVPCNFEYMEGPKTEWVIALVQFYVLRKLIEHEWNRKGYDHKHAYICSLSAHTIVYKGQLMPQQVHTTPSYNWKHTLPQHSNAPILLLASKHGIQHCRDTTGRS